MLINDMYCYLCRDYITIVHFNSICIEFQNILDFIENNAIKISIYNKMKIRTIELIIRLLSRIKSVTCFLCRCESFPQEELEQEKVNGETIDHLETILEEQFKEASNV